MDVPIDMECWLDIVDDLPEELWASEPRTRASQVTNAWGFSLRVEVVQLFSRIWLNMFLSKPRGGPWVTKMSHAGNDDHT